MHFGHQSDWYQNQARLVLPVEYFVPHNMKRAITTVKLHLTRYIFKKRYSAALQLWTLLFYSIAVCYTGSSDLEKCN